MLFGFSSLFVAVSIISCSENAKEINDSNASATQEEVATSSNLTAACTQQLYSFSGDVNSNISPTIDDRDCTYQYDQTTIGTTKFGRYRLKADSNGGLQTRIERAAPTVSKTNNNYVRVTGICRIARVGSGGNDGHSQTSVYDRDGTYFIQAKGDDTAVGGSNDPAIVLLLAKSVSNRAGVYAFDIYAERVTKRGGELNDRELIYVTRVNKNTDFSVVMTNGFRNRTVGTDTYKEHYVEYSVNGGTTRTFRFNKTESAQGTNAKIRMGAYRCHGGEANIMWRNVNKTVVNN